MEHSMNLAAALAPDAPSRFAARVAFILTALALVVAAHFRTLGPHTVPLWTRITRAAGRIARLMARLEAGRLRPPARNRQGRRGGPPPASLPREYGWLVHRLRHEAAMATYRFERLLDEPETAQILAAAPGVARILRPICRLLAVNAPILRPARPTPPAPAAPPAPGRPAAAEPAPAQAAPDQAAPKPPRRRPLRADATDFPWLTARALTAHFLKPA
jgi:hypothetical protein